MPGLMTVVRCPDLWQSSGGRLGIHLRGSLCHSTAIKRAILSSSLSKSGDCQRTEDVPFLATQTACISYREQTVCGPGRQLWPDTRVGAMAYLLPRRTLDCGKWTTTHKTHRTLLAPSALCGACAGILGERGSGLVVHFPLGCVAKINTP